MPRPRCSRPGSCPAIAAWSSARGSGRAGSRTSTEARCPRATRSTGRPAGLRPHLVGRTVTAARARAGRAAGRAARRRDHHRGRGARQEPPDPVRQRPRAADPPPDERLVAPLPARRALAPAAGPGASRARGARARSPSASMRRWSSCSRRAPRRSTRRSRRLGPDLLAAGLRTGDAEALRRLRDPARAGADDRRGAPRPAGAGRDRQRLQERGPVHRAGRAVRAVGDLDDATSPGSIGTARRLSPTRRASERSRPPAVAPHGCCTSTAGRPAVPPLRHASSARQRRTAGSQRIDVLVPALPAGRRAVTWTVEVQCAGDRRVGWTCSRPIREDGAIGLGARDPGGARRPRPARPFGRPIRPTSSSDRSPSCSSASRRRAILRTFDLTVIGQFFPAYESTIRAGR